ncbi:MAG: phospholipid carrier-dependent glycosyltransferase, partial [Dongiaceae bacterium]
LGDRPISAPSEARYAEIGREMAATNDFVTPRLNTVKYFEKPPLFYWVQAGAIKAFGLSEFVLRLPTALFGIFIVLITYLMAYRLYGQIPALWTAAVQGTCILGFALSRVILLDIPVSFFLLATLFSFIAAIEEPKGRRRDIYLFLMYTAAAGAVLTKGLIGIVIPGAVIFLWLALTKQWRLLLELRLLSGILWFLLLAAPWHILVSLRNPEFPWFYFVHEHWLRFTTKIHGRYEPWWFFIPVLILGFWPWMLLAGAAVANYAKGAWKSKIDLLLLLWVGFIFFFFSYSDSKLIPYIFPVFPVISLFTGRYLAEVWEGKHQKTFRRCVAISWWLLLLLLAISIQAFDSIIDHKIGGKLGAALEDAHDEVITFAFILLGSVLLLGYVILKKSSRAIINTIAIIAIACLIFGDQIADHHKEGSTRYLAKVIQEKGSPDDEVINWHYYNQDLPVYLKRRITIVDWRGELAYGAENEPEYTKQFMIDDAEFWRRWQGKKRVFVVMRSDAYAPETAPKNKPFIKLLETAKFILVTNQPLS